MKASTVDLVSSRLAVVLGACFAIGALSGEARAAPTSPADDTAAQTDAEAADQAAAELMEHHRHHHHGGVTKFIAMSLDTLGVAAAEQPKVDKLQKDLYGCMTPARDLENGLLSTLADGIAAGTIDTVKVDATIGQLDAAATTVHDCSADTLNQLHRVLSRAERAALVTKVQAHWDAWRQANDDAVAGGREKGSRLAALAKELDLTPDQMEKMSAALTSGFAPLSGQFDRKRVDAHVSAFATAFVHKSFDARSLKSNANGHLATCGAKRTALFYETVTPLLTPEQRATLAQHLREHAGQQLASSGK
jgi:Spy/CpxP family protein refolding chaperone